MGDDFLGGFLAGGGFVRGFLAGGGFVRGFLPPQKLLPQEFFFFRDLALFFFGLLLQAFPMLLNIINSLIN